MERRTLVFILISTAIFVIWSMLYRPAPPEPTEPLEQPTAEQVGDESSADEDAPNLFAESDIAKTLRAQAEASRTGGMTTVGTLAYEVDISHATASLRAFRLNHYPKRNPKGRLGDDPVDLIPVYSADYGGLRFDGGPLDWMPVDAPANVTLAPAENASVSFVAVKDDVEIVKTFRFQGASEGSLDAGSRDAWRGYAIDIDLSFKNLSDANSDAFATGYEFRWGPGIAMDRERHSPGEYGAVGGELSTGQLTTFSLLKDADLSASGPQDKNGDLDDPDERDTVWAAMHSKYFLAALIGGGLAEVPGMNRRVRFSEYDAFPMSFPREPRRYRLLLDIGKEWLKDDQHFGQPKQNRFLIFPTGTRKLNGDIAQAVQGAKDDDKSRRKLEERLEGVYAEYGDVQNLLTGTRLEASGFFLKPGQTLTDRFRIYAGPKHTGILSDILIADGSTPAHVNETVRLGFTGPLSKGLLWLLKLFHKIGRNYGVAIIILTILVRLAMYPISQKSSESMKKMQNRMKIIQPEVDEVRQKHRDDAQRMNAEMMKVYRKYGINPASQLGGCLMIVAQMPIFFAMFAMLRNSAELRGEPFILWIDDLTAPDLLFSLAGFPIRILPLFMTVGTIIQQKMNPTSAGMGGAQQRMMYLMPLLFLFMFYNMASGLNLYWGVSTLIGVGQQFLVNRYGKSSGEENLTAADLERMAREQRKKRRRRGPTPRSQFIR